MITPAHTLTASERVLPRLALDFTTAVLDPRVTVTRSGNTATVTNSNGSVSIVNADLPRFDYVNGVCRGLLIEESRANLLLNSVFDGAVAGTPGTAPTNWTDLVATGTIASVSAGTYAAGNAIRITNTGTRRAFYRTQSVLANTTYSYSITVTVHSTPAAGYPRIQDCMFLANGPAGSTITYQLNGAAATAGTAVPNGQTSKVVAILAVGATAGTVEVRCGLGSTSTVDGDITIQMPQFEAGAFPTSYIPTTTTSLTRNADAVTMTGTNFSDWFNATEGTFVLEYFETGINKTAAGLIANAGAYTDVIGMYIDGSIGVPIQPNFVVLNSNSIQANILDSAPPANSVVKMVAAYKQNSFAFALNGLLAGTDATGTIPTVNQLQIGNELNGVFANRHFAKVSYFPQRLTNAEVQAFSK